MHFTSHFLGHVRVQKAPVQSPVHVALSRQVKPQVEAGAQSIAHFVSSVQAMLQLAPAAQSSAQSLLSEHFSSHVPRGHVKRHVSPFLHSQEGPHSPFFGDAPASLGVVAASGLPASTGGVVVTAPASGAGPSPTVQS